VLYDPVLRSLYHARVMQLRHSPDITRWTHMEWSKAFAQVSVNAYCIHLVRTTQPNLVDLS
jgi:hypothetical protein